MADEWTVSLVLATDEPLPEDTLVRMDELVEKGAATVAARGKDGPGFSLTMDVETEHFGNAVDETVRIAYDVADQVNILVRPVELHVMAPELFEKRALEPDFPPLASAADAAEILGVSRQRVHQLHASNTRFPAPVTRVATGPLWAVPAIEHFAEVWERKPGRPSAPGRPAQPVAATRTGR